MCFYDGLIDALINTGHNVLQAITHDFLFTTMNGTNKVIGEKYVAEEIFMQINSFAPDLIISFNNSSIEGIEDVVTCPIIVWGADAFENFNDLTNLINKQERYYFFLPYSECIEKCKKMLTSNNLKIYHVPNATAIKRLNVVQDYNISFIGNPYFVSDRLLLFLLHNQQFINDPQKIADFPDLEKVIKTNYGIVANEIGSSSKSVGHRRLW